MIRQRHYVIYVPGIKDDMYYVQSLLIQCWRLQGVRPVMFTMPWSGKEPFEPKISRLVSKIDDYRQSGHRVSLIGTSAGASAVLNAYFKRRNDVQGAIYICGKINRPDTVSDQTYTNNPSFKTSLQELQKILLQLNKSDKRKLYSFYSPTDTTVPHADTIIEGVAERGLPPFSHMWAILYTISLGSRNLLRPLGK